MSKSIFFSYRRSQFLAAQLMLSWVKNERGPYATFIDVDDIKKGESWADRIQSELLRCSGVILIIDNEWQPAKTTGSSSEEPGLDLSDWMSRELFIAHVLRRQILPVYLSDAVPTDLQLPNELAFLRQLQHVNIRSNETLREQFEAEILPWIQALPHSPYFADALDGVEMVKAILKNLHQSLKWLWQFLMAVALVNAFRCVGEGIPGTMTTTESLVGTTLALLSFIGCFIRFYLGDSRYLDLSYLETTYERGLESEIHKFSPTKRLMDVVLLLSIGGVFFIMSGFLTQITQYLFGFVILMLVNVFWLVVQLVWRQVRDGRSDYGTTNTASPLTGGMKADDPLRIWVVNNVISMLLVMIAITLGWPIVGLIITLVNSVFDFYYTWPYYFPSLIKIRDAQVP